jgi:lysozyme family protein
VIGFFPTAFKFTLGREMGFSNDPNDPGGATNLGITQATLDDAHERISGLPLDVRDLTQDDQARIYQTMFWTPVAGDLVPNWAALALFDAGVNSGPATAVQWLQQALGVNADGRLGNATQVALLKCDARATLREFHARRAANYMNEIARAPLENTFALGWSRRLLLVHDTAAAQIQT